MKSKRTNDPISNSEAILPALRFSYDTTKIQIKNMDVNSLIKIDENIEKMSSRRRLNNIASQMFDSANTTIDNKSHQSQAALLMNCYSYSSTDSKHE